MNSFPFKIGDTVGCTCCSLTGNILDIEYENQTILIMAISGLRDIIPFNSVHMIKKGNLWNKNNTFISLNPINKPEIE